MSLQDVLLLIYTIAMVTQVIVVAVTLIFLYKQAQAASLQIASVERSLRVNAYLAHRQKIQEMNRVFAENPAFSDRLGYRQDDFFAFMLIGWAESAFYQRKHGVIDDDLWRSQSTLIRKAFSWIVVQELWASVKGEYMIDFVTYVDNTLMPPNKHQAEQCV